MPVASLRLKRLEKRIMYEQIRKETVAAFEELCKIADFPEESLLVIGGSSSEIKGESIGKDSSYEIGTAVVESLLEIAKQRKLFLAFQCCEHLNRALIMERNVAKVKNYQEVTVVPWLHAGGAFATNAYYHFDDPVAVESINADGGLDIGFTMIGMHLRKVAVPVRLKNNHIGKAVVIAARTRPPLVGGERARYKRG